ncbi:MAG: Hpt domain-containing protein [Lysobacterales bacterium]
MKLNDATGNAPLAWVKHELDETLKQARQSLVAYSEDPSARDLLRQCATQLHQVQGTLRMVELYGAAMVVEEMEHLAQALAEERVRQREESCSVLMRGLVQLPDYLERLQGGYKDIPIVLLPLLNDVRACLGEKLLSESALFSPDLGVAMPASAVGAAEPAPQIELHHRTLRLRLAYQAALLKWYREESETKHLDRLIDLLDQLRGISFGAEPRRLWWIAAAVVEAVRDGALEPGVSIKLLLGAIDREIKRFGDVGETGFVGTPPHDLDRNLLYYVAHAESAGARCTAVRGTYHLDTLLPTETELRHAQGSMTGHNRMLLDTVSMAIRDDLLRVKEALDIHLRSAARDGDGLSVHLATLARVADTLGMLGLGVPRRLVNEQCQVISEIADGRRPADENVLLDVAGALLYVEASLDDHIERLGAEEPQETEEDALPSAEVRKLVDALMREAGVNITRAKDSVIAFIESPWDHERLAEVPRLMREVAGALGMLGQDDAARVARGFERFVDDELLRLRRIPAVEQMDRIADVVAALEYYLEATREQRGDRGRILEVARGSLGRLGYWPVPPTPDSPSGVAPGAIGTFPVFDGPEAAEGAAASAAPVVAKETEAERVPELSAVDIVPGDDLGDLVIGETGDTVDPAHDVGGLRFAETIPTAAPPAANDAAPVVSAPELPFRFQDTPGVEIGADIRDVFLEEVDEELANLEKQLPRWKSDPADLEELRPLRRSWHTLKGSGRLVGAVALGEFAWKIENALNRVLDRTVTAGRPVVTLVERAVAALPQLRDALRDGATPTADIAGLMGVADRAAAGSTDPFSAGSRGSAAEPDAVAGVIAGIDQAAAPHAEELLVGGEPVVESAGDPESANAGQYHEADRVGTFGADAGVQIDPVLFDILKSEADTHLAVIADYLQNLPAPASEILLRALHTLHGAIAMVEIPTLVSVLAPLEGYVKRLRAAGASPAADGVEALRAASDVVRATLSALDSGALELPDTTTLAERAIALRDELPEPSTSRHLYAPEPVDASESTAPVALEKGASAEADVPASPETPPAASGAKAEPEEPATPEPEAAAEPATAGAGSLGELPPVTVPDTSEQEVAAVGALAPLVAHALESVRQRTAGTATVATMAPPVAAAVLEGPAAPPLEEDPQPDSPLDIADLDSDLLDIFVDEGRDILDHADGVLAKLRGAPDQGDHVTDLRRDLHTLKGGARMAGLPPVAELSHAMESLLEAIGEGRGRIDRCNVESLESGFDRLKQLLERVADRKAVELPTHAIRRFEQLAAGVPLAAAEAPKPAKPARRPRDEKGQREQAPAAPIRRPAPPPVTAGGAEEEEPGAPREMIRVRSELLDNLVNFAGEVSIYRSRLEQQVGSFRFNLVELDQTVKRLREQLRTLEMETEAQIIARYQREHHDAGGNDFDPLELDRFSHLQQLSRAIGESVSDLVSIQGLLEDTSRQSETLLQQQSRVNSDLQEGLMRTRMVPFEAILPNLRRTLRQTAHDLGKRAQLRVEGAQGEMDRTLLDRMKAPFEHMLRNALAHGIEMPDERVAAGKPADGTVTIAVSRDATEVVLQLSDDGRGLDRESIRRTAIERGLMRPETELGDRDLYGFVLESGFSTAGKITQLAGRGVGMDVVHNEIKQLGGSLRIDSVPGRGATFTVRLPFTLAVTQAILVQLAEHVYAVPLSSVLGVARISREDLARRMMSGTPVFPYAGEEFAIYELSQLLGVPPGRVTGDETQLPLLMTRTGDQRAAVRIDAVIGSREIVVKSVGPQVSSIPGIFGATIMGDGSVVMILDLAPLVRRVASLREQAIVSGVPPVAPHVLQPDALQGPRAHPLVMVVDDSITMRKVTSRVLERAELEVVTAKDGLDAIDKLQERVPDLMLLDIEMPRMDGYELATYMRNDARLKHVPIIMVTSRTGEKHRQRALEVGVRHYLGKPYQEADLLAHVLAIVGAPGGNA